MNQIYTTDLTADQICHYLSNKRINYAVELKMLYLSIINRKNDE